MREQQHPPRYSSSLSGEQWAQAGRHTALRCRYMSVGEDNTGPENGHTKGLHMADFSAKLLYPSITRARRPSGWTVDKTTKLGSAHCAHRHRRRCRFRRQIAQQRCGLKASLPKMISPALAAAALVPRPSPCIASGRS